LFERPWIVTLTRFSVAETGERGEGKPSSFKMPSPIRYSYQPRGDAMATSLALVCCLSKNAMRANAALQRPGNNCARGSLSMTGTLIPVRCKRLLDCGMRYKRYSVGKTIS
jgi:hypothetical protein